VVPLRLGAVERAEDLELPSHGGRGVLRLVRLSQRPEAPVGLL
jgi:hypothetical protein